LLRAGLGALALALCQFLPLPGSFAGEPPSLGWPLRCSPGKDCWVQNYVDHDPGLDAVDFTCGHLTYDGHDGTDIRLPDYAAMRRGVPVLAAADGTVLRVRDGMADVNVKQIGRAALHGKDAGNAVVIDDGGGWQTAYAHLRKGSIMVKPGQHVVAGQQLGLVGLSGNTEFPHVHFGVQYQGKVIDPYTGAEDDPACGKAPHPMWNQAIARDVAYEPSGVLSAGFTGRRVSAADVLAGGDLVPAFDRDAALMIFFVSAFGVRQGDIQDIRLVGPDGTVVAKAAPKAKSDLAVAFLLIGRKLPGSGWQSGSYRGEYELIRQVEGRAEPVAHAERQITVP
jgi:hypothetical protein